MLLKGLSAALVLMAGVATTTWFFVVPPQAKMRPEQEPKPYLVDVVTAEKGNYPVDIAVMGRVIPAQALSLRAQVSGEVRSVSPHFVPGGIVEKNEALVQLDPRDFEIALKSQKAALAAAKADYRLELGKQQAAQVELNALSESSGFVMKDASLALREPHIEKALAEIDKAQAAVDQAALALARTQITTPFDGLLTERLVNMGDWVSAGSVLATVVNASTFWVEVDIPIEQLHWLTIPVKASEKGSRATIFVNGLAVEDKASVYRLTGSVDSRSRMAKLLIAIDDPLNRQGESNARSLFLGDHVKVVIHGKALENVSRVPYAWVQEGEKLWIAQDDVLNIRPISPLYRDSEAVYIGEEVNEGDQIIVSDIVVPVAGMQLNVMRDNANDLR